MRGNYRSQRRKILQSLFAAGVSTCGRVASPLSLMPFLVPAKARTRPALFIAAASSLRPVLRSLAQEVPALKDVDIHYAWGATGKLYAQIVNGAPYDLFFAADAEHPALLEKKGLISADCRRTFALGRLVLYAADGRTLEDAPAILRAGRFHHLAMANPRHAPYGRAARETLVHLALWDRLRPKIVYGENVGQTFHFLRAGAAELGFVALSQILTMTRISAPNVWLVPETLHHPLMQQAVVLRPTAQAHAFLQALQGRKGLQILRRFGYDAPPKKFGRNRKVHAHCR